MDKEKNTLNVALQASLNWGKKDEPVYVTEESGVVGLNFHQSKEVLIHDTTNGVGSHYDVRILHFYRSFFSICVRGSSSVFFSRFGREKFRRLRGEKQLCSRCMRVACLIPMAYKARR